VYVVVIRSSKDDKNTHNLILLTYSKQKVLRLSVLVLVYILYVYADTAVISMLVFYFTVLIAYIYGKCLILMRTS